MSLNELVQYSGNTLGQVLETWNGKHELKKGNLSVFYHLDAVTGLTVEYKIIILAFVFLQAC